MWVNAQTGIKWGRDPHGKGQFLGKQSRCRLGHAFGWAEGSMCYTGAHWSHLAHTTEPSVCGGDAALCQITLTTTNKWS